MAVNGRAHGGRDAITQIADSGGVLRNISPDLTNVEVPTSFDTAEVSGMTDSRKSFIAGQGDTPITLQGNFQSGTAANAAHKVLSGILGGTAPISFEHYPAGSASGLPKVTGNVICDSLNVSAPLGGAVSFQATLKSADSTGLVWSTV